MKEYLLRIIRRFLPLDRSEFDAVKDGVANLDSEEAHDIAQKLERACADLPRALDKLEPLIPDETSPCSMCGRMLHWYFYGDATFCTTVETGNRHTGTGECTAPLRARQWLEASDQFVEARRKLEALMMEKWRTYLSNPNQFVLGCNAATGEIHIVQRIPADPILWKDRRGKKQTITHWMPLPPAAEEKKETT